MIQYRLQSGGGAHAPTLVRRALAVTTDAVPEERARALYLLANAFPSAPAFVLLAVVAGRYHVEGSDVVVGDSVLDAVGA